jgi:hypothetical protein
LQTVRCKIAESARTFGQDSADQGASLSILGSVERLGNDSSQFSAPRFMPARQSNETTRGLWGRSLLDRPAGLLLTGAGIFVADWMIRREEKQLELAFGQEWVRYKRQVRRWL